MSLEYLTEPLPRSWSKPGAEMPLLILGVFIFFMAIVAILLNATWNDSAKSTFAPYFKFAYVSFFKPHTAKSGEGQQSALESFYSAQASIYDVTRRRLLQGREDMLALVAANIRTRMTVSKKQIKPIWFDIGGGTGYNIEIMDKLVGVDSFFEHVYLVDLSTSLCEIARERVRRCGWSNVTVLCQDARLIQCEPKSVDLVTMSYSLSMIPDYYNVVDMITGLLSPTGLFGICDFYVQSIVDISSRNYTGGSGNRHVNWLGRMFWRTWFDADRVNLDGGRRDYVEYRFGTILSANQRNYLLGGIPYYIFLGCAKEAETRPDKNSEFVEKIDASLTESPYLSPKQYRASQAEVVDTPSLRSKSYESAIINLSSNLPLPSAFYQQHPWRIHYNELLQKHQQFGDEYIYAFNWEDPKVDHQLLGINKDDVILTITSAGDNILDYMLEKPKRIHAVDLNPNQNHLLELKVAAFQALSQTDVWNLFRDGKHPGFRDILINQLSPHLSSQAFQYWLSHTETFTSNGLFETGGSRHAIRLVRWLFKLVGLTQKVRTICTVETLNEQREIWPQIRKHLLSRPLHTAIVSTEWWAWKAAGVPPAQHKLIVDDHLALSGKQLSKAQSGEAIWKYVVDTLDPMVATTQISRENYFYYVCLQGKYSQKCCPRYLQAKSYAKLSRPGAFDGLRIHTDDIMEVIARITPSTLTIAIIMDSMDWFDPTAPDAQEQILALNKVLKQGGRVLFRSAALRPWYTDIFEKTGFAVKCVGRRDAGKCIDRVNMYASTWICTKTTSYKAEGTTSPKSKGKGSFKSPVTNGILEELEI